MQVIDLAIALHADDMARDPSYGPATEWEGKLRKVVADVLKNPSSMTIIAVRANAPEVVGVAIGYPEMLGEWLSLRLCMHLRELYVKPDWRGYRIGTTLIQKFELEAWGRGFDRITLFSHINNRRATEFYLDLGYRQMSFSWEKEIRRV